MELDERRYELLTAYPILCKSVTQLNTIAIVCSNATVKDLYLDFAFSGNLCANETKFRGAGDAHFKYSDMHCEDNEQACLQRNAKNQ